MDNSSGGATHRLNTRAAAAAAAAMDQESGPEEGAVRSSRHLLRQGSVSSELSSTETSEVQDAQQGREGHPQPVAAVVASARGRRTRSASVGSAAEPHRDPSRNNREHEEQLAKYAELKQAYEQSQSKIRKLQEKATSSADRIRTEKVSNEKHWAEASDFSDADASALPQHEHRGRSKTAATFEQVVHGHPTQSPAGHTRHREPSIERTRFLAAYDPTPRPHVSALMLPPAGPVPAGYRQPKITEPPTFNGDPKDKEAITQWQSTLEIFFQNQPLSFYDDQSKVNYAVALLRKRALEWIQPFLTGARPIWIESFPRFCHKLKEQFGEPDEVYHAGKKLIELRQKEDAGGFLAEVERWGRRAGANDAMLYVVARYGMKPHLQEAYSRLPINTNWSEFKVLIQQLDVQINDYKVGLNNRADSHQRDSSDRYHSENSRRKYSLRSTNGQGQKAYNNDQEGRRQRGEHDNGWADHNKARKNGQQNKPHEKLDPEEKRRRFENDLCIVCGKPGHYRPDCPERKSREGDRPSSRPVPRIRKMAVDDDSDHERSGKPAIVRRMMPASDRVPMTVINHDVTIRGTLEFTGTGPTPPQPLVTTALLDSGASHSFIRASSPLLHYAEVFKYKEPKVVRTVEGVGLEGGPVKGFAVAHFDLGIENGRILVHLDVIPNISNEVILGLDFLTRSGAQTDWDTMSLVVPSRRLRATRRTPEQKQSFQESPIGHDQVWGTLRRLADIAKPEEIPYHMAEGLDINDDEDDLEADELRKLIPAEYWDSIGIFRKSRADGLPPKRPYDHAVDIMPGPPLRKAKAYPLSKEQSDWLKKYIDKGLENGTLRPSQHWFGSPVFLIKKKNGDFRLVTDYRVLNAATVSDIYPLPLIDSTLDLIRSAKFFSKLDMPTSYQLLRMREEDVVWTTIVTQFGSFESLVMREGMKNAGASFQCFMNSIFHRLLGKGVVIYIDDILVYSETMEEHVRLVKEVFSILSENGLYLKPSKCEFHKTNMNWLGFSISPGNVEMETGKVSVIKSWPTPKTIKDVQKFLGFANFYRRFIWDFSGIARPLTRLTRKSEPWKWSTDEEASFEGIKDAFSTASILAQFDPDRIVYVETDASNTGVAAVISQVFPIEVDGTTNQVLKPVGFMSKGFTSAQANYTVWDRELTAFFLAFVHWRALLLSCRHVIQVITDHKNLEYFTTTRALNARHARVAEYLSDYNFQIRYRPGSKGGKPDALTRHRGFATNKGRSAMIKEGVLLPHDLFVDETIAESEANDAGEPATPSPGKDKDDEIRTEALAKAEQATSSIAFVRVTQCALREPNYAALFHSGQEYPYEAPIGYRTIDPWQGTASLSGPIARRSRRGRRNGSRKKPLSPTHPTPESVKALLRARTVRMKMKEWAEGENENPLGWRTVGAPAGSHIRAPEAMASGMVLPQFPSNLMDEDVKMDGMQYEDHPKMTANRTSYDTAEAIQQAAIQAEVEAATRRLRVSRRSNRIGNAPVDEPSPNEDILREMLRHLKTGTRKDIGLAKYKTMADLRKDGFAWIDVDRYLLRGHQIVVPDYKDMRLNILQRRHDAPVAGHPGREKTIELILRDYWWPGLAKDVGRYVEECHSCSRNKARHHVPYGLYKPIPVPTQPGAALSFDFIEGLPVSKGYTQILVVVDRFTKRVLFIPTVKELTAVGLGQLFLDHVFRHYGLPDSIISDRGHQMLNKFWADFCKRLGISHNKSTAYRPQTDGQTERVNQTVETYLRHYVSEKQDDWVDWLALAEFTMNNSVHSSTKCTPFFALMNYHPRFDVHHNLDQIRSPAAHTKVEDIDAFRRQLVEYQRTAIERTARYYNQHHQEAPEFQVGELVWLSAKNIKIKRPSQKLGPKYIGPLEIIARISTHAYRLRLPEGLRIHDVFHVSMLERAKPNTFDGRIQQPAQEIEGEDNEEPTYEIEAIDNSRIRRGVFQYRIVWKGYTGRNRTSWFDLKDMDDIDPVFYEDFHACFPDKPRPAARDWNLVE